MVVETILTPPGNIVNNYPGLLNDYVGLLQFELLVSSLLGGKFNLIIYFSPVENTLSGKR